MANPYREQEVLETTRTCPDHEVLAEVLRAKLDALERSLGQLSGSLQERVGASQGQTLEHLLLYESAIDELQVSATGASAVCASLLGTCKQLGEELRGVDLLAGRVATLRAAAEQLEIAVEAVVAGKG